MAETTQAAESERSAKTQRLFYNAKGEESNRVQLDSTGFKVIYVPTGYVAEAKLEDFSDEVRNAGFLFGVVTNITNAIGSKKLTDEECVESIEARMETLTSGRWTSERDTGPRTSDLIEAMKRLSDELNRPFDAEKLLAAFNDEENGPALRKKYMGNDKFKAHFDAIKLERAMKRREKSQEAAKAAPAESADELFDV